MKAREYRDSKNGHMNAIKEYFLVGDAKFKAFFKGADKAKSKHFTSAGAYRAYMNGGAK